MQEHADFNSNNQSQVEQIDPSTYPFYRNAQDLNRPMIQQMNRAVRRLREDPLSVPAPLPDWLRAPEPPEPVPPKESIELFFAQCDMVFPRVLDSIYKGYTLAAALRDLPIQLDPGLFYRWLKKDPKRQELYKEAKEIRTEAWAGKILQHAEGVGEDGTPTMDDVARSKLVVDTYKWLMQADNRKTYGDTKQIDVNTNISITAALAEANARVGQIVDVEFEEVVSMPLLESGEDEEDE